MLHVPNIDTSMHNSCKFHSVKGQYTSWAGMAMMEHAQLHIIRPVVALICASDLKTASLISYSTRI